MLINENTEIEKATHYEKYDIECDEFIAICKEINYTQRSSRKARIVIQKQLKTYHEPQTQFLVLSLLKDIIANCQAFEKEYRDKEFIESLSKAWNNPTLNRKVRDIFRTCIQMWLVKYTDDLYLHHLIVFCKTSLLIERQNNNSNYYYVDPLRPSQSYRTSSTAAYTVQVPFGHYDLPSPPLSQYPVYNNYNPYNNTTTYYPPLPTPSPVQQEYYPPSSSSSSALVPQQNIHRLQHFYPAPAANSDQKKNNEMNHYHDSNRTETQVDDDDNDTSQLTNQNFLFSPSAAAVNHGAVVRNHNNRNSAFNAILRTSESTPTSTKKGVPPFRLVAHNSDNSSSNAPNGSLSRYKMDALIEEASTTAHLLNDMLVNGPVNTQDDVLDELYNQCRSQHGRIFRQIWLLDHHDIAYQDVLTDKAREIYQVIKKYKKTFNDKILIDVWSYFRAIHMDFCTTHSILLN